MTDATTEDMMAFMKRLHQQWEQVLNDAPDDMKAHGVACIQGVIALLTVADSMNRDEFDFGMRMLMTQSWLLGLTQARVDMALKVVMKEDATIGQARTLLRKISELLKTRGRDEKHHHERVGEAH